MVLSACSPYFRKLLKANPCEHPIVILRDIRSEDVENLLRCVKGFSLNSFICLFVVVLCQPNFHTYYNGLTAIFRYLEMNNNGTLQSKPSQAKQRTTTSTAL